MYIIASRSHTDLRLSFIAKERVFTFPYSLIFNIPNYIGYIFQMSE